jgi:hypothetical protein
MTPTTRTELRELAEQLITEYAGAIAPGQVLAVVFRNAQRLALVPHLSPAERLRTCELSARRALTDRLAVLARGTAA